MSSSRIEPGELLVHQALELRVEGLLGDSVIRTSPGPRAHEERDDDRATENRGEREQPCEKTEATCRRLRENAWTELRDERALDLLLGPAVRDPRANERLHSLCHQRVRLVERRLARRTDELCLEIGRVRRGPGRRCGNERGCDEDAHRDAGHDHVVRASAIASRSRARSSSVLIAPTIACTTLPSRSTTYVSGSPVTP